ncbi:dephospho-CoA kinase [Vagococcus sp. BWB3-3]|uniref:Dephospho-CoA kinase n=1 Tax=Vagococcus allomyrinae TaxID=2794353 RepID=A0A940PEH5_9ENTE|nr:dephospho-CoA kinase [Vagococcus allomyrinae]MBP1044551.1 dephospho-CoA kinase [Vagococcus allomyrinae]
MTFILGLTGGIATGKSTVADYFRQLGLPIVDSDTIAREVVEPGTVGLENIRLHFGDEILTDDGRLNRKKLGSIVFSDESKRRLLNRLLSEELAKAISGEIDEWVAREVPIVVVDVPLMYEADYDRKVDQVMVVYLPEKLQLQRLIARDQLSEEEAKKRITSQMPIEEKRLLADIVIDNSGSVTETQKQLREWLKNYK